MADQLLDIDGSQGEGGGQVLRSALALSVLTGTPFRLVNVRANRNPPGLRPQHLACVKAAADICGGRYTGGSVGSSAVSFAPGPVRSGRYTFRIGTAGATGLVLHTVVVPLALRGDGPSEVVVTGGTHVPHAPCFHYNHTTWAGYLRRMGIELELTMSRAGFYPAGGGEVRAVIRPCREVRGLRLVTCPELTAAGGFSAVSGGVDGKVADRQARRLAHRLNKAGVDAEIGTEEWDGGPGTVAAVVFRQAPVPTMFVGLGERGKPAEAVADEAADQAAAFQASAAPVDPHAADQLLVPLAFAAGPSEYRVGEVTRHLTTNADVVRLFVDRPITCEGKVGGPGRVTIG